MCVLEEQDIRILLLMENIHGLQAYSPVPPSVK